jgi:hypothetical protein
MFNHILEFLDIPLQRAVRKLSSRMPPDFPAIIASFPFDILAPIDSKLPGAFPKIVGCLGNSRDRAENETETTEAETESS